MGCQQSSTASVQVAKLGTEPARTFNPEADAKLVALLKRRAAPAEFAAIMIRTTSVLKRRAQAARVNSEKRIQQAGGRRTSVALRIKQREAEHVGAGREDISAGVKLLAQRFDNMRLVQEEMEDDGNCQFRACSDQIYGDQKHHAHVRAAAIAHMKAHDDEFSMYFDDLIEWQSYLSGMSQSRTWGDELTLRAIADAYGVHIHVITSTTDNWYLECVQSGE